MADSRPKTTRSSNELEPKRFAPCTDTEAAASVSVHGANRLGSNSLLDLVVFGRESAMQCQKTIKPMDIQGKVNQSELDKIIDKFDSIRYSKGSLPTSEIRAEMQSIMQKHASVFRTEELLCPKNRCMFLHDTLHFCSYF